MCGNKKLICGIVCGALILVCALAVVVRNGHNAETPSPVVETTEPKADGSIPKKISTSVKSVETKKSAHEKKANLYSDNQQVPLSAIPVLAGVSDNIKKNVADLTENANLYLLKRKHDKIFMIIGNTGDEAYPRHDVEFVEINTINGHQQKTSLGYSAKNEQTEADVWEFDEETKLPLRHIRHNTDGEIEFSENWNYSEDEPVKYEMKDADGNVISMRKETKSGDSGIRVEHLIYDGDGNTKMNVSANYEGPDVTRFTYYNASEPDDSETVMSEYSDGVKVKETVYSSDYKIKNVYNAGYKDGERTDVTVLDGENKEVDKFLAE